MEDIDLENAHTTVRALISSNSKNEQKKNIGTILHQPNTRVQTPVSSPNSRHFLDFEKKEKGSTLRQVANGLKNGILMLPALFILCVILFVSYCTLYLAIPWRFSQESKQYSFPILTLLSAITFTFVNILCIWSFLRCVFTSSHVSRNPPIKNKRHINSESTRICNKCHQYKPQRAHHCRYSDFLFVCLFVCLFELHIL